MGLVERGTNGLVRLYLSLSLGLLLVWCLPYNLIIKQKILSFLTQKPLTSVGGRIFPMMGMLCLFLMWKEWKKQKKMKKILNQEEEEDGKEARGGEESSSFSKSFVGECMDSVQRLNNAFLGVVGTLFGIRAMYLASGNVEDLIDLENRRIEESMIAFKPPNARLLQAFTAPFYAFLTPVFIDVEKIPQHRPLLFVSNHTIMGLDFPLLLRKLWIEQKIFLRALADHSHFQIPVNSTYMREIAGAVDGTRRNVDLLMENGSSIFVYPGGARETFKRTTDKKYSLIWGQRKGFATMAIRHGCTIVPVTNFGTEDMLDVVGDLPLGWVPIPFLWRSDRTLPLMKPTKDAYKGRVYFLFGDPIHTSHLRGREDDVEVVDEIVEKTKGAIEDGIEYLREYSEKWEKKEQEEKTQVHRREWLATLGRYLRNKAAKETGDQESKEELVPRPRSYDSESESGMDAAL